METLRKCVPTAGMTWKTFQERNDVPVERRKSAPRKEEWVREIYGDLGSDLPSDE